MKIILFLTIFFLFITSILWTSFYLDNNYIIVYIPESKENIQLFKKKLFTTDSIYNFKDLVLDRFISLTKTYKSMQINRYLTYDAPKKYYAYILEKLLNNNQKDIKNVYRLYLTEFLNELKSKQTKDELYIQKDLQEELLKTLILKLDNDKYWQVSDK